MAKRGQPVNPLEFFHLEKAEALEAGADALEQLQATQAEIEQLDHARSDLYDELRTVREDNDRFQKFEQAIVDAFGELRWDKISTALVALHAPDREANDG
jgi:septal ring factor EnvC (AmiA/AmiB activator)